MVRLQSSGQLCRDTPHTAGSDHPAPAKLPLPDREPAGVPILSLKGGPSPAAAALHVHGSRPRLGCAEFPHTELDTTTQRLRGFLYQAVGQLASRAPQPFHEDPEIAARLISALSAEPAGVRAALQEAVATLASAYKGCPGTAVLLQALPHGTCPCQCAAAEPDCCGVPVLSACLLQAEQ